MRNLELIALVKGKVQGVGFRYITERYAKQLNLKGTVRNLPDGNVEIFAQGTKENCERLLEKLKSTFSNEISNIEIKFSNVEKIFEDFIILR